MNRSYLRTPRSRVVAGLAAAAVVGVTIATVSSGVGAAPAAGNQAKAVDVKSHILGKKAQTNPASEPGKSAAKGGKLPKSGKYGALIELDTKSTLAAYNGAQSKGAAAAKSAAKTQFGAVQTAQQKVIAALPKGSSVLYKSHSVLAGVAVYTDVRNFEALTKLPGVKSVHPIAPKSLSNSYAVNLQGAPAVWTGRGDLGQNTTIAIIDTGIDYTHADFGGPGTEAAYNTAHAAETQDADPALYPNNKVIGGYDLVGDDYNADPTDPAYNPTPAPDNNPLDCNGHGSHVAGSAAGLGENADGSTYTGSYNANTPFDTMRIGPGMAPAAKLYAFRVFGCAGSTDVVGAAIDRAGDPNGDGDPSDHVDVINMSLGADFGSPQDGDSSASNAAVDLGITVAVASGNAGDYYDIGGSPGDANKVITVANTQDAYNQVDAVYYKIGSGAETSSAASRAVLYDWSTKPDLAGNVALLPPGTGETGDLGTACAALTPAQTAAVAGKVALVKWTQEALECGSIARGANLRAAGAAGYIFSNSAETFDAGINGDTVIPGVLISKSGGDAIKAAVAGGQTVTVTHTAPSAFRQVFTADNDKINVSSSRGIHANGNVKPDVAAVGTSVFSTLVGSGNQGESLSGTSMATPMVAGLAALVKSAHPDWTPAEVKADIMNTAGQDVYTGSNHTGDTYAPNRVGAGRIKADAALANNTLAYVVDDPGSVSVSFGPVEVTGATTLTKTVKVANKGVSPVTYNLAYQAVNDMPGVTYTVSPSTVTLSARSSTTVTVTLSIPDPKALTKTVDPTKGRVSSLGYPSEVLSDASGRVTLTPTNDALPTLRLPVYSAPRPASTMTQQSSINLTGSGDVQTAAVNLTGTDVGNGGANGTGDADLDNDIFSINAGFELQATSGVSPQCSATVTVACYRLPEEKGADLKYVGYTSDYPIYQDAGASQAYFAVSTQAAYSIPASKITFQIDIDVDGDKTPDLYLYNTRLGVDDLYVAELYDPAVGVIDDELINGRFGDIDTAAFDSDTMVLPLFLDVLADYGIGTDTANGQKTRISYGVETYSAYSSQPIDLVGVDPNTGLLSSAAPSADLFRPGVRTYGVGENPGEQAGPLVEDFNNTTVTVAKDNPAYKYDKGLGLLMVHFHNKVGNKAQVVPLTSGVQKVTPTVQLRLSKTSVSKSTGRLDSRTTVVRVNGKPVPTGTVYIRIAGPINLTYGPLNSAGYVDRQVPVKGLTAGKTYQVYAYYTGDGSYNAANSAPVSVTITP